MSRIRDKNEHADFATSGIESAPIQELSARTREIYIQGLVDCNEDVHTTVERLRNSLIDMTEITEIETEFEWRLLNRFMSLFEQAYFDRLDKIKEEEEIENYGLS
jgi:hypothetical protein